MTADMYDFEHEFPKFEKKCWGEVIHVFTSSKAAISVLRVEKGFRCSKHYHVHRTNSFEVLSGRVEVCYWPSADAYMDRPCHPYYFRILTPVSIPVVVPCMHPHYFRVLESGLMVEIYKPEVAGVVRLDDIVRFDVGGPDEQVTEEHRRLR